MIDDIEFAGMDCPDCGAAMLSQRCFMACEDGRFLLYDEDPLYYGPGEYETCQECNGRGHITWCPECGYTLGEDEDDGMLRLPVGGAVISLPPLPDGFDFTSTKDYVVGLLSRWL